MTKFVEDDDSQDIVVSNVADWMKFNTPREETSTDLFKVSGEDLSKISGLSPAFRRKMNRDLQKRFHVDSYLYKQKFFFVKNMNIL